MNPSQSHNSINSKINYKTAIYCILKLTCDEEGQNELLLKDIQIVVGINVNISSSTKLWFLLGIQGHLVVLHLILRACLVSIILGLTQTLSSIKLVIEIKIILLDAMDCQGCV